MKFINNYFFLEMGIFISCVRKRNMKNIKLIFLFNHKYKENEIGYYYPKKCLKFIMNSCVYG